METHTLSSQDLAPIVEMSEAEAWNDFFLAAPGDLAAQLGIQTEYYGSTIAMMASGLDQVAFNRVIGLGILEPADPAMVDAILGEYEQARVPTLALPVSPFAQPPALPDWLRSHGLAPRNNWAKVYRGAQPSSPVKTDLRIEMVDQEQASVFATIACTVHGLPTTVESWLAATVNRQGWHQYLALDGDRPIACAALFIDGNVGWMGWSGALASDRKRGAQSALLERRMRDGIAMGCEWFVSECEEDTPEHPNPAFHNLLQHGFQLAYLRPNWTRNNAEGDKK